MLPLPVRNIEKAAERMEKELGAIDILANNAMVPVFSLLLVLIL